MSLHTQNLAVKVNAMCGQYTAHMRNCSAVFFLMAAVLCIACGAVLCIACGADTGEKPGGVITRTMEYFVG